MANRSNKKSFIVPLCCAMGIVSALLHWIVPTRLLLGNPAEYAIAAVAAVLGVAAFALKSIGGEVWETVRSWYVEQINDSAIFDGERGMEQLWGAATPDEA